MPKRKLVHAKKALSTTVQIVRTAGSVEQVRKSAAAKRAVELLALIDRRKERILEDFYDIGVALSEILKKQLFRALDFTSFDSLLEARVQMSRAQAWKLVAIGQNYTRSQALALGLEKSYQLVRYTVETPEPETPSLLLETGAKIGRKSIEDATVRDLVDATRAARKKKQSAKAIGNPKQNEHDVLAQEMESKLRKRGARHAKVTAVNAHSGWELRIVVPVGEAKKL